MTKRFNTIGEATEYAKLEGLLVYKAGKFYWACTHSDSWLLPGRLTHIADYSSK